MCGVGGAGVHSSVGGGVEGQVWNGECCGGMNGLAVRQGGVDRAWETWKCLHWLSKMEAFCFHSAHVSGMGWRQ